MRYLASKNSVTLKSRLGDIQGHWKRRRSIDHIRLSIAPPTAIVNVALSATVFELFDVEWYHDLEIWVRGHSGSFTPVPFESLGAVPYSPSIVTMAISCTICEIEQDICQKSWFFHTPLHSMPPSEHCHPVWCGKTRMVGLPDSEKSLMICITV